ncbi:MAG: hypothetical protein KC731_09095 [Myxococcales bacterium]|nr:hypothetical protein [Myxococcales bacterium]
MRPQVFFPQSLLDVLLDLGKVDLDGEHLVLPEHGLRYRTMEAVRVVAEVTTGEDGLNLCGKVSPRAHLTDDLGAEILGNSMLVEESAYDVIPGFAGIPADDGDGAAELEILQQLQNIEELV